MAHLRNVIVICLALMLVRQTFAQTFTITQYTSNNTYIRVDTFNADTAYTNVGITTDCRFAYINAATTVDIGVLTFTGGPSSGVVHVVLGTAWNDEPEIPSSASGRDLQGLLDGMPNATISLYGRIAGGFPGSNGSGGSGQANNGVITVSNLVLLKVDGVISGTLTVQTGEAGVTTVLAQKVSSAATIRAVTGDIDEVHTTGNSGSNGEMAGLIKADAGNINDVITDYGDLTGGVHAYSTTTGQGRISNINVGGDVNSTALIGGLFPIRSYHGIGTIVANSINAKITSRADANFGDGVGRIDSLQTRTGNLSGELVCAYVGPSSGSPSFAFRVAGSLSATLTVDHTDGLQHPIFVNAAGGSSTWTGDVQLGVQSGNTLSGRPFYTASSTSVGGSAIGLVPYAVYDQDCVPALAVATRPSTPSTSTPDSYTLTTDYGLFTSGNPLKLRFYGPASAQANSGFPIRLYRITTQGSETSIADLTCHTSQTVHRLSGAGSLSREIVITYPSKTNGLNPGTYAITTYPLTTTTNECSGTTYSTLYSDGIASPTSSQVRPFRIDLTIEDTSTNPCVGGLVPDVDDGSMTGTPDSGITIDDLLYYLHIFELGDISADVDDGSGTHTLDQGVTIDDLLYYLYRFELGC